MKTRMNNTTAAKTTPAVGASAQPQPTDSAAQPAAQQNPSASTMSSRRAERINKYRENPEKFDAAMAAIRQQRALSAKSPASRDPLLVKKPARRAAPMVDAPTIDIEAVVVPAESSPTTTPATGKWQAPKPLQMATLTTVATLPVTLTADEKQQLAKCETIIKAGIMHLFEVGNALRTVREGKLYRDQFESFDAYCQSRWGFRKSQASRYIIAAQVSRELAPMGDRLPSPLLERHVRPFTGLKPEDRQRAVSKLIELTGDGKATSKLISTAIALTKSPAEPAATTVEPAVKSPRPSTTPNLVRGINHALELHDQLSKAVQDKNEAHTNALLDLLGDELRLLAEAIAPTPAETVPAEPEAEPTEVAA